jgi:hypothetical protein
MPWVKMERWLPVSNAEGYEVSDWGRVWSVERKVIRRSGEYSVKGKFLRLRRKRDKHDYVGMWVEGEFVEYPVHLLVLNAFIGLRPPGMECRHLDGNPTNNKLNNLCWGTRSDNTIDRKYHAGQRNHKLKPCQVREIRQLFEIGTFGTKIAKLYGISFATAYKIRNGEIHQDVR